LGGRNRRISVSSRPAWSIEGVPGQPGLQKKKKKKIFGLSREENSAKKVP
jgi:hypothetical protein